MLCERRGAWLCELPHTLANAPRRWEFARQFRAVGLMQERAREEGRALVRWAPWCGARDSLYCIPAARFVRCHAGSSMLWKWSVLRKVAESALCEDKHAPHGVDHRTEKNAPADELN
eukprot:1892228-Rhodomonas_salina.1